MPLLPGSVTMRIMMKHALLLGVEVNPYRSLLATMTVIQSLQVRFIVKEIFQLIENESR